MTYRPVTPFRLKPARERTTDDLLSNLGWMLMCKTDLTRTPYISGLAWGWSCA